MADNTILNSNSTVGDTIASDDIGGIKFQRIKIIAGNDGVNDGDSSKTNPFPVLRPDITSLANNLTPTSGNAVTLVLSGSGGVGVQITGTWTGTLIFEATLDGTNWFTVTGTSAISGFGTITTTTANGQWRFTTATYQSFRVRCSVTGTGTAVVNIVASPASSIVSSGDGLKIMDGLGTGNAVQVTTTNALSIVQADKIQTAANITMTATGNTSALTLNGRATAAILVTGTWTGTLALEGTVDATNWNAINYYDDVNLTSGNLITVNGTYRTNIAGYQSVRLRSSVTGTGTASVAWVGSGVPGLIGIQDPLPGTAKGIQGAIGVPVQNLKDAGRVNIALTIEVAGAATAEGLTTVTESRDGAATSTFTSKVITSGKRIRFQSVAITVESLGSGTAPQRVYLRLRVNTVGATTTSSPEQCVWCCINNAAIVKSGASIYHQIPDGFEISGDGTKTYGLTLTFPDWVTSTATVQVKVTINAFEY